MQDTIWRDSLTRSGFKNLRQIVTDVYGYPDVIEPKVVKSDAANPEEMEEIPMEKDKVKMKNPAQIIHKRKSQVKILQKPYTTQMKLKRRINLEVNVNIQLSCPTPHTVAFHTLGLAKTQFF